MATAVIMPRQGQSVESCIITKWYKQKGDKVSPGELLFAYETDKAAFEEEAKTGGVLLDVFFEVGDDVPCLMNVCAIGEPGESAEGLRPAGDTPAAEAEKPVAEAQIAPLAPSVAAQPSASAPVSPRALKLASARGVNPALATGTGPNGRVIERDIEALIAAGQTATPAAYPGYAAGGKPLAGTGIGGRIGAADVAEQSADRPAIAETPVAAQAAAFRDEPLPGIRKSIARAMQHSLSSMAQLTHTLSFDATEMLAMRAKFKEKGEPLGLAKVTLGDIVLYAVSRTLLAHPALNAHFLDDKMRYFASVNLGVAVDTPRGLMVPTVFGADRMSLAELSAAVKALAAEAVSGKISPDKLSGGTFTVSNLGSFEIEHFTPVINPPQTGILGVNTITERVRRGADGGIELYPAMALSLTYDHRALDGAPASRFLQDLKRNLENFTLLLCN